MKTWKIVNVVKGKSSFVGIVSDKGYQALVSDGEKAGFCEIIYRSEWLIVRVWNKEGHIQIAVPDL